MLHLLWVSVLRCFCPTGAFICLKQEQLDIVPQPFWYHGPFLLSTFLVPQAPSPVILSITADPLLSTFLEPQTPTPLDLSDTADPLCYPCSLSRTADPLSFLVQLISSPLYRTCTTNFSLSYHPFSYCGTPSPLYRTCTTNISLSYHPFLYRGTPSPLKLSGPSPPNFLILIL
jgi:hypothetical protein